METCVESHPSVGNGWCSFSKGTQSEGLTSGSSSDESKFSSMKNSNQDIWVEEKISKRSDRITKGLHGRSLTSLIQKVSSLSVTNISEESNNGKSTESTELPRSKLWINWNSIQIKWLRCLQWSILLSFGAGLWAALCLADVLQSDTYINKEGWLAEMVTTKRITAKADVMKKPASHAWWFFNFWFWNYIWRIVMSTSALEAFVFLSCFVVMIYMENHVRKKWEGRRNSETQFSRNLLQVKTASEKTDNYRFSKCSHFSMFEEEITLSTTDNKLQTWWAIELSEQKNASGDVKVEPTSSWQTESCLNLERMAYCVTNNGSAPIKNSISLTNNQSWPWQDQVGKNTINSRNVPPDREIKNELDSHKFCAYKVAQPTLNYEKVNSNCINANNASTTSLHKCFTQSDSSNLNYVDDVTRTFNLEIDKYPKVKNNRLLTPPKEMTKYSRQSYNFGCTQCDDLDIENCIMNNDISTGIISSSPAFQKFLLNLQGDKFSSN